MHFLATALCLTTSLFFTTAYAANPIILISIDGLRPDAIKKADAKYMLELIEKGTSFDQAMTVRPSVTVPSHVSMLTGLDPKQHGFIWDDYRPEKGPVKDPTALEIAHQAGLRTAMFVSKDKLIPLNRPGSLDYFEKTEKSGSEVAKAFKAYVEANGLPDVTFLHLPDPDKIGHFLFWMSPFYLSAVRDADDAVRNIVDTATHASAKMPTIIITADHGGNGLGHLLDIETNNRIPFFAKGEGIAAGVVKHEAVRVYDAAPTILSVLGLAIPENWLGRPAAILAK
jgi:predicted AlkP superfamily pyrophosphatase or phosphodiesterase